jgi:hypothetical protein
MNFQLQISRLGNFCVLFISLRLKHKLLECLAPQVLMDLPYIPSHDHRRLLSTISFSYLLGTNFYSYLKARQYCLNLFMAFSVSWKYTNKLYTHICKNSIQEWKWNRRKAIVNSKEDVNFFKNVSSAAMYLSAKPELQVRIRHWKKSPQNSDFNVKRRITFQHVLSATFSVV